MSHKTVQVLCVASIIGFIIYAINTALLGDWFHALVSVGAISANLTALSYIDRFVTLLEEKQKKEEKEETDRVIDGLLRHIEIRPKNNH